MAEPGWTAPFCPLVTPVEDADRVVTGHHDDVIVLEVLDGALEYLPDDHNARLLTEFLAEFGEGRGRCRAPLLDYFPERGMHLFTAGRR